MRCPECDKWGFPWLGGARFGCGSRIEEGKFVKGVNCYSYGELCRFIGKGLILMRWSRVNEVARRHRSALFRIRELMLAELKREGLETPDLKYLLTAELVEEGLRRLREKRDVSTKL
jgi:hypothetical protein